MSLTKRSLGVILLPSLLNLNKAYPYILVGIYDTGSCWAYLGRPSSYHKINLGWCKTMSHKGSMVHELGHGLGINHEQKRADGSHEYYGKGPHLQMFWENTGQWKSQYTPATNTYIGSADDGGDDPQIGYAPYDFAPCQRLPDQCKCSNFQLWSLRGSERRLFNMINCHFHGCLSL
eukprot:s7_g45.t1